LRPAPGLATMMHILPSDDLLSQWKGDQRRL
jgi:hypothetical protein